MSKDNRFTIGFDVSDTTGTIAVIAHDGNIVTERSLLLTPEAVHATFSTFPPSLVALEAGGQSRWLTFLLHRLGHHVLVANPRTIPLLTRNSRKSDRMDALLLARIARIQPELLHPITLRSHEAQRDYMELLARDLLVRQRTAAIAFVRAQAKQFGVRLADCDADQFHRKALDWLPQDLLDGLEPLLHHIHDLTEQIKRFDRRQQALLRRYPAAAALQQQIHGVGSITALAFVLTIDDPRRFTHSRTVGAYAGLAPRRAQSGTADPQLHISKAGNSFLRKLLVQCAQYILGPFGKDSDLRRWGLRKAGDGNRQQKRRAVVGMARKLAVLMHALWTSGEVYEPLRNATVTASA